MRFYKYILNFLTNESKNTKNSKRKIKQCVKMPLFLLSLAVIAFTKIKRAVGNIKAKEPGLFTISFGNINMGGSGKTPFSYALAEYLYGKELKPCIITRGYKGRLKKKSI